MLGDLEDIKNISIYFDGIRYPMMTSLTAVDMIYKIMFVFNLEFPKQSEIFYTFIQIFFFEMATAKKKKLKIVKEEVKCLTN